MADIGGNIGGNIGGDMGRHQRGHRERTQVDSFRHGRQEITKRELWT